MHLINTTTLELKCFIVDPPPYAILSHTWGDGEVSLQEFTNPDSNVGRSKKGFDKIERTCAQARRDGLRYAWVDTCCIDKSSSAELSEAINSMFAWYKRAQRCYVFLEDLVHQDDIWSTYTQQDPETTAWSTQGLTLMQLEIGLRECRWFGRGWTLQELIAPSNVVFYDRDWKYIGHKIGLISILALITGIDPAILEGTKPIEDVALAARMSWASKRYTTRPEDMSYCLFGLFDVSMPLLYGEGGQKAFYRLQEEILKETTDLSLLAWRDPTDDSEDTEKRVSSGVLAYSPALFEQSGKIYLSPLSAVADEFAMTNKGLHVDARLIRGDEDSILPLGCEYSEFEPIGIFVRRYGAGLFKRQKPNLLNIGLGLKSWRKPTGMSARFDGGFMRKPLFPIPSYGPLYLSKRLRGEQETCLGAETRGAFHIDSSFFAFEVDNLFQLKFKPEGAWDPQRLLFLTQGKERFSGRIRLCRRADTEPNIDIVVGFDCRTDLNNEDAKCPTFMIHKRAGNGEVRYSSINIDQRGPPTVMHTIDAQYNDPGWLSKEKFSWVHRCRPSHSVWSDPSAPLVRSLRFKGSDDLNRITPDDSERGLSFEITAEIELWEATLEGQRVFRLILKTSPNRQVSACRCERLRDGLPSYAAPHRPK